MFGLQCVLHCCASGVLNVRLMHYSRDPQIFFFSKIFIKNGSHGTIHTFKNYFVIVFSVFSFTVISDFQTDPKSLFLKYNEKI